MQKNSSNNAFPVLTANYLSTGPEGRGLRDGIFDATQGPIWYYYYLIAYFMKIFAKTV